MPSQPGTLACRLLLAIYIAETIGIPVHAGLILLEPFISAEAETATLRLPVARHFHRAAPPETPLDRGNGLHQEHSAVLGGTR